MRSLARSYLDYTSQFLLFALAVGYLACMRDCVYLKLWDHITWCCTIKMSMLAVAEGQQLLCRQDDAAL